MKSPLPFSIIEAIARLQTAVKGEFPDSILIVVIHRADNMPIDFVSTLPPGSMCDLLADLVESLFPADDDGIKH